MLVLIYLLLVHSEYASAFLIYTKSERCGKTNRLLKYAITTNCYIPPLLLNWEGSKTSRAHFIDIGYQTEAYDYIVDNRKYWDECKGAQGM